MSQKIAVIDLGTNTFHLMIIAFDSPVLSEAKVLFKESTAAKIGQKGINKGIINPEAIERAVGILQKFKANIDKHEVTKVYATGTSAIRNASNQAEFLAKVETQAGIVVEVLDGNREAELIYCGVKEALKIGVEPAMIMDIGGGSVEFIICNEEKIFWKQSFEIGGQRLIEMFMKADPISSAAITKMNDYFTEQLLPLSNACHQYAPQTLIGSSGSFDTLADMYYMHHFNDLPNANLTSTDYPREEFYWAYDKIMPRNREERMNVPGMISLRVEMIVVAMCLIKYILKTFGIKTIKVSSFALKEGILAEALKGKM
jgi:exopolyphosphatase / guanosine-5'-triphosphate,3'-diphosphate pyrophosphatase